MPYIMLKKNLTLLYVREKNSKSRDSYPPPPQKSHGQPHREGRGGLDSLVNVIHQQNGWRAFIQD